jgi:hypothetical protein
VICYNVLHCSQKAAPALVLKCYGHRKEYTNANQSQKKQREEAKKIKRRPQDEAVGNSKVMVSSSLEQIRVPAHQVSSNLSRPGGDGWIQDMQCFHAALAWSHRASQITCSRLYVGRWLALKQTALVDPSGAFFHLVAPKTKNKTTVAPKASVTPRYPAQVQRQIQTLIS